MNGPAGRALVAVNVMRARLTVVGFNLAIVTFQIHNARALGGGVHFPGFDEDVHLSAGMVMLAGVALSIAALVVFVSSIDQNREGTCDPRMLLVGDLLMYSSLAQTVTGFFGPYVEALSGVGVDASVEQSAMAMIRAGVVTCGAIAWTLAACVGPIVSLVRSPSGRVSKLGHAAVYLAVMLFVSRLWTAGQQATDVHAVEPGWVTAWLHALVAPLAW